MRGRSLLWAGPGVLLLRARARAVEEDPLAGVARDESPVEGPPAEAGVAPRASHPLLRPTSAPAEPPPATARAAQRAAAEPRHAGYARSRVTKTNG